MASTSVSTKTVVVPVSRPSAGADDSELTTTGAAFTGAFAFNLSASRDTLPSSSVLRF